MFKFIKLYDDVILPQYETSLSSGLDLRAYLKGTPQNCLVISPGERRLIPTGLKVNMMNPVRTQTYQNSTLVDKSIESVSLEAQIRSRSGLAAKHGVCVLNSPGTIDQDYEGELKVILYNASEVDFIVEHNDRIAQIVFSPIYRNSDYLSENIRGEGGFNSTGLK